MAVAAVGADAAAAMCVAFSLLVLLVGLEESLALNWNPVPRKTVRYHGKWVTKFISEGSCNQIKLSSPSWFLFPVNRFTRALSGI